MDLTDTRFWELYKLDCKNKGLNPSIDDYVKWMDSNYPNEEPYDLYMEWIDGEPYIDNVRINCDLGEAYEPRTF